jgi:hypothetical protein
MFRIKPHRIDLLLALGAAVVLGGCVRVKVYERSLMSTRVMRLDPDPTETKMDGHVSEYREGSIGGAGVSGGGCGCN